MTILEVTARRLFAEMESAGLRYAVLRNYEYLFSLRKPDSASISDIDLVVDSQDLDLLRKIIARTAARTGWDSTVECGHWARSPVRDHNVEVFRLYVKDSLVCLQVDVFHAFHVHGVPLFDEQQLLGGRQRDPLRDIMRIDPDQENAIRLIQIFGLADAPRKRERYRQRLLAHVLNHGDAFLEALRPSLGWLIGRGVRAFVENDLSRAKRYTDLARVWFLARYSLRHPVEAAERIFYRMLDYASRFYTNQCGCVGCFHAPEENVKDIIRSVLDQMVAGNFINHWAERQPGRISFAEHIQLEQSSLLLRWTGPEDCDIDFGSCGTRGQVAALLVDFLASRHEPLTPSRTPQTVAEPA
jgi:hypothetical protein